MLLMTHALTTLFNQLNKLGVKYFLLTDFECDLVSNDLDLFVHPDSRCSFERALVQLGWYKRKEPAYHVNHHFYYSPDSDIYLDVKYSLSFARGENDCFTYLYEDQAIANASLNNIGVYRPQGQDAIILYTAHLAFKERGKLENKHKDYLTRYINDYRLADDSLPPIINEIEKWLTFAFPSHTDKLQMILHPFFRFSSQKMTKDMRYSRHGMGLKVLFLGTDGAGKTTLLEATRDKLNIKTQSLYLGIGDNGWSSSILKQLYRSETRLRFLRGFVSIFKTFVLLPIELVLRILPVMIKSRYSIVLIDRVPGAYILQNSLSRLLYKSILPTPDIVFFIYADPKVLTLRKPNETTLERSKADIQKFERVADVISGGKYISIDTSTISISEARDIILANIYKDPKMYDKLLTTSYN